MFKALLNKNISYRLSVPNNDVFLQNGFIRISRFPRYAINKAGAVYDLVKQRFLRAGYSDGYYRFTLVDETGVRKSVTRHRLIAMIFIECPDNCDDLQVNHKNGVRGDDKPENLEWVTCKENITHAFLNGLKVNVKPIVVENVVDGSIEVFETMKLCCAKFGIDKNTLKKYLTAAPWVYERWPFRIHYKEESDRYRNDIRVTAVLVRDMRTKIITEFKSIVECSQHLGIDPRLIQSRINSEFDKVYPDGLQIRRKRDNPSWYEPANVEEEIKRAGRVCECLMMCSQTKEVTTFPSQRELASFLKISEAAAHQWLSTNGERVFKTFNGTLVQVKRNHGNLNFKQFEDPSTQHLKTSLEKVIIVRNIHTKEEVEYKSGVLCAKAHGLLTTTTNYRLSSRGQRVFDNTYLFKYKTDQLEFKQLSETELSLYEKKRREKQP